MHGAHVVKLGGSLLASGQLAPLADRLARTEAPLVIVPGGGPFADAIRAIQPQAALTDRVAHGLALLAMHQMAHVICSLHPRFAPVAHVGDVEQALSGGLIPVWLPYALQNDDPTLPADWTTTSDALAARLAERLGGDTTVTLVKSCPVDPTSSLADLVSQAIVDPIFATVVGRANLAWRVVASDDAARTLAAIDNQYERGGAVHV